jgi:hypothetical protein
MASGRFQQSQKITWNRFAIREERPRLSLTEAIFLFGAPSFANGTPKENPWRPRGPPGEGAKPFATLSSSLCVQPRKLSQRIFGSHQPPRRMAIERSKGSVVQRNKNQNVVAAPSDRTTNAPLNRKMISLSPILIWLGGIKAIIRKWAVK